MLNANGAPLFMVDQAKGGAKPWEGVFKSLAAYADNEYAMIDSTIVRAHQHSAGALKKKTRMKRSDAAKAV